VRVSVVEKVFGISSPISPIMTIAVSLPGSRGPSSSQKIVVVPSAFSMTLLGTGSADT
jgi:hypothetical protein